MASIQPHKEGYRAFVYVKGTRDTKTLCKICGWSNTKQALTYYNPSASQIAAMLSGKR